MVRHFSLWCTALILLTSLASLGISGCGGGPAGMGGQGLSGRLTIHVTQDRGLTRVRVAGREVQLTSTGTLPASPPYSTGSTTSTTSTGSTSSSGSTQNLAVELYRLPLQSPPTPLMARSFTLVGGQTQAIINEIPAPAHYQVRGYLYPAGSTEYDATFLVEDVEVLPGVVATATSYLTPRPSGSPTVSPSPSPSVSPSPSPSPSVSPSPSPSASPYALMTVGTSALPGQQPRLAMRSDGKFVVAWISGGRVYARGFFVQAQDQGTLWGEQLVSEPQGAGAPDAPFPAIDPAGRFGVAWTEKESTYYAVRSTFRNLADGTALSGVGYAYPSSQSALEQAGMGMGADGTHAVVNWRDRGPSPNVAKAQGILVPSGTMTGGVTPFADPAGDVQHVSMDMAWNGDFVQALWSGNDQTTALGLRLSANGITPASTHTVATFQNVFPSKPSVAIRNGRVAVVWAQMPMPVGAEIVHQTLYVQRFTYNPQYIGAGLAPLDANPIQVNPDSPVGSRLNPQVAMDDAGNFVVAWEDYTLRDPNADIYHRAFNAAGTPGPVVRVNPGATGNYGWPSVGMAADGTYVVAWGTRPQGAIYAQPFAPVFPAGQ